MERRETDAVVHQNGSNKSYLYDKLVEWLEIASSYSNYVQSYTHEKNIQNVN
jgi:hypothetical protein